MAYMGAPPPYTQQTDQGMVYSPVSIFTLSNNQVTSCLVYNMQYTLYSICAPVGIIAFWDN